MHYKIIVPSRELRLKILKMLDFLPDLLVIKIQYKLSTGRSLKINNVKRYTEKLQWYKIYYRNVLMTQCSDKHLVRQYISSKGYEKLLIPQLNLYNDANEINFNMLPEKFVLKTTNGSHSSILCIDKSKLDQKAAIKKLNNWINDRTYKLGREWSYYGISPRIICEEFLEDNENNELIDYKFFCFNGVPFCLYVIVGRHSKQGMSLGIYDLDFKRMPYDRSDIKGIYFSLSPPRNFQSMVDIAKDLSKDFPHVRVDLYNVNGTVYFGELTFYDGSGYQGFTPDEFDFILGDKFYLPGGRHHE